MPNFVRGLSVRDIRFPTKLSKHGSSAMVSDPDYSCAYVVLFTSRGSKGIGYCFTIGRGTEIVVQAVKTLSHLVVGQDVDKILHDFATFWRKLTSDSQIRWLGPEKGVIHMAAGAIINALWDLWGKLENKPVWKLLADMSPEQLVSTIDFTYLSDVLTKEEAQKMLEDMQEGKRQREKEVINMGYPTYTKSGGFLGYSDENVRRGLVQALLNGFTKFKIKVGSTIENDKRRLALVRSVIGWDKDLMLDANQKWEVKEAIDWVTELKEFKPVWIEEPTSPDDVSGHAEIAKALKKYGIGVASGEHCQNRVVFKQFLKHDAMQVCQIDACRLAGVNEILAVLLLAKKFNVPVCPHAGGVGLCEMIQHIAIFDYVGVSGTLEGRAAEYSDLLHDHFLHPVKIKQGRYIPPKSAGFSTEMLEASARAYEYPMGQKWNELFEDGKYEDPRQRKPKHVLATDEASPLSRVPSFGQFQMF